MRWSMLVLLMFVVLTPGPAAAQWPGENGRISYVRPTDAMLFTVNPDGSDPQPLGVEGSGISWSPTRNELAFGSQSRVFVLDVDTGSVTSGPGPTNSAAAWSPDGNSLATTFDGQLLTTCVHRSGGCVERTLYDPGEDCYFNAPNPGPVAYGVSCATGSVAWSPDGAWVAFTAVRQEATDVGAYSIWLVRPDGSDVHPLYEWPTVPLAGSISSLDWTPDSTLLSFDRALSPEPQLASVDLHGTLVNKSPGLGGQWAPDGVSSVYVGYLTDVFSGWVPWVRTPGGSRPLIAQGGSVGTAVAWKREEMAPPVDVPELPTGPIRTIGLFVPALLATTIAVRRRRRSI